ncbi:replication initiator [Microbacterium sp. A8/3-1]|uniref:Replication initiator n=1 Tax=Microbacterium sp. A8/3-1 TaxID=3160749 RepID=A0AAU7W0I7_9MICO
MATVNPLGPLTPDTLDGLIAAATSTEYETWWGRVRSSGYCAHPIHLTRTQGGQTTTLYARCENRRETACPACSDLYALDTWHIVTGGLTPDRMTDATALFLTLTAPSFGTVHTHRPDASRGKVPCHPGPPSLCTHGASSVCTTSHVPGDPLLGSPLCAACYDYETHALTTWWFPALWNRYVRTLRRLVTRHIPGATVSFVKVMEMQARLAPHYHAILRANSDTGTGIAGEALAALATLAASTTRLDIPTPGGTTTLRFGTQTDTQPLPDGKDTRRVAGYLAKYVTKTITATPLPARIPAASIGLLPVGEHHKQIMRTLARLATALPNEYADMADRLATLGWRGHTTTKSRTFSTTMTAQKQHRAAWRAAHAAPGDAPEHDETEGAAEWEYQRAGHKTAGHRYLAVTAALTRRERLRTAHTITDIAPEAPRTRA